MITADPKRLVILYYETAIDNLKLAQESYASKDYETKAKCLQKAQDIICELTNALDLEHGGEVAKNLSSLYGFLNRHILEADLKKDIKAISEDIKMLEELKSTWQKILYATSKPATIETNGGYLRQGQEKQ